MKAKSNAVEESNRLLEQLNTVLVSDLNGNAFSVKSEQGGNNTTAGGWSKVEEIGLRRDSSFSTESGHSEELNDPEKSIGRVGEEHMKNILFFLGFVAKFLQLVVASALLMLAIEWQPLEAFLEEHVDKMFYSFLILGLVCIGLLLLKLKFRWSFMLVLIVNMLFMINFFWYMVASSFDSAIFSPYWIVLCAITQTAACLFLSVLVYFQKATYKGCGIYGYANIVPILFLILSQPYYFWWYLKLTGGAEFGENQQHHHQSHFKEQRQFIDSSDDATAAAQVVNIEKDEEQQRQEMLMSYPYYMINVCSGIGLAMIMTFEMVAWSQYSVKGLKLKAGAGILSGSFTALNENTENPQTTQPEPVNL